MPWRPLNTPDRRGTPEPIALPEVLDAVLAGIGGPKVASIVLIHERWGLLIGPEVADHANPQGVENGVLTITADSSAWASHLRWSEADIVARCAEILGAGEVTAVTVRVARG